MLGTSRRVPPTFAPPPQVVALVPVIARRYGLKMCAVVTRLPEPPLFEPPFPLQTRVLHAAFYARVVQ